MVKENDKNVAYFCMEYGLHEDMRIYSGGLGILAGDILKASKDLNKNLIGIGLLWRQGYTKQLIG
ncbi:MAG: alpha-glucan family phosphorylase, partial [Bacillota bacterium]